MHTIRSQLWRGADLRLPRWGRPRSAWRSSTVEEAAEPSQDTNSPPEELDVVDKHVSAFGQGRDGEVYVVTHDTPSIYRLAPAP